MNAKELINLHMLTGELRIELDLSPEHLAGEGRLSGVLSAGTMFEQPLYAWLRIWPFTFIWCEDEAPEPPPRVIEGLTWPAEYDQWATDHQSPDYHG